MYWVGGPTAGWCFAVLSASRAHRMLQAHRCCAFFMGLLQALHAARSLIDSKSYILVFNAFSVVDFVGVIVIVVFIFIFVVLLLLLLSHHCHHCC